MTNLNLQATRTEQYADYVERAIGALNDNNLELAAIRINAAQYIVYDLELQALDIEEGE